MHSGFGNYSLPTCFNWLSEQGVVVQRDRKYLVALGLVWAERDMGALYISILGLYGIVPLGAIHLPDRPATH